MKVLPVVLILCDYQCISRLKSVYRNLGNFHVKIFMGLIFNAINFRGSRVPTKIF